VRRRQVFRVPQGLRSQVTGSSGGSCLWWPPPWWTRVRRSAVSSCSLRWTPFVRQPEPLL